MKELILDREFKTLDVSARFEEDRFGQEYNVV
jgi:hypothetical protein